MVCVASGPSLTVDACNYARAHARVIVVNDGYRVVPNADALVALDADWWARHGDRVRLHSTIREYFTVDRDVHLRWGATYLEALIRDGLSLDWDLVHYGADSGHMALQLAVLFGARDVYLLGYDMGPDASGKRHWFGDHPAPLRNETPYEMLIQKYEVTAQWCKDNGIRVVNCSPTSRLTCFEKARIEDVL